MTLFSRTATDTGLVISDSIGRSVFTVPGPYQVSIHIPFSGSSPISGQLLDLLNKITPAHIQVTVGYNDGFIVGVSLVGIDAI